jgi:Histidine kinase-, DNA gyrase B-, and HSP90-like ATPase
MPTTPVGSASAPPRVTMAPVSDLPETTPARGSPDARPVLDGQQAAAGSDAHTDSSQPAAVSALAIATVGHSVGEITVSIGPQFLELFSEHLYSSPNKTFEELVSNSWDAGASSVHIGMSADLAATDAAVWVLDNGVSMDQAGLEALWAVATSQKRTTAQSERPQIGKFGIGKLATYILADCLTYVCKAADGVVRAVTMDYRRIDEQKGERLHIDPLPLAVRELDEAQLAELFGTFPAGAEIAKLIENDVPPAPPDAQYETEFQGPDPPADAQPGTWTLAILTSLKDKGRAMQAGHIKRMLRYALPLGASLGIVFNEEPLYSTKVDADVDEEWILGKSLGINAVTVMDEDGNEVERVVSEVDDPGGPHVVIDGVQGKVTGTVRLYSDRISGGKSEAVGSSNGFFINVLGRVVNAEDPYFGLENLSHSAWAKFRATIRADGLDDDLAVNREGLLDTPGLAVLRAFLFAVFNKARNAYDASFRASWPNVGQVLTDSWGTVPLEPLRDVIKDGITAGADLAPFIDDTDVDPDAELQRIEASDPDNVADFISDVVLEDLTADAPLVKYELATHRVVVNRQHPFAQEHGETHEQQLLLRDAALVDLLTQAYMASLGVDADVLEQIANYREQSLRLIAQRRRRTGVQLGRMLVDATQFEKGLERVVGDALEYLGFEVRRLGQPGKTEGVATAPVKPTDSDADLATSFSFTYDAKSSGKSKVKTSNVGVAGLVRHRTDEGANFTLVIAPDYESGGLEKECETHSVTPMRARDLARLLLVFATHGPVDLSRYQTLFDRHSPDAAETWVDQFVEEAAARRVLRYDVLLAAINKLGSSGPDAITTSVLAREARALIGDEHFPTTRDVHAVLRGLEVLLPHLVRLTGENAYFGVPANKLREAIREQLQAVPDEYKINIEEPSEEAPPGQT